MRAHRNILYACVFIIVVMQIISFVTLSSHISNLESKLGKTKAELINSIDSYHDFYQTSFNEISSALADQQKSFDKQIVLLKSQSGDFSEVIESSVRSVVSVGTDKSAASGFIVNSEGYIVTNSHVVEGAKEIKIMTYEREIISAILIGIDINRDIALLKVPGRYTPLKLADSDSLQVGEKVIAIGNPLGLAFSVSQGIISAVHREGPNGFEEYIQTDVSLNPGNSGGPLIDSSGKVVGINNFKVGGTEGLGFALESNPIRNVINQLADKTIAS